MFRKIYRNKRYTKLYAAMLLLAIAAFSVNFLAAYAAHCSVSSVLVSEEKKSDGETESEKESDPKLDDFFTEVYSSCLSTTTVQSTLFLSLQKCRLYYSFYSNILTPPPQL